MDKKGEGKSHIYVNNNFRLILSDTKWTYFHICTVEVIFQMNGAQKYVYHIFSVYIIALCYLCKCFIRELYVSITLYIYQEKTNKCSTKISLSNKGKKVINN